MPVFHPTLRQEGEGRMLNNKILAHEDDSAPPGPNKKRQSRCRTVLDAAEELFLQRGFAKVSLGEILRRSAYRCYEFVTAPQSIAMLRIAISESLNDPDLGRKFYRDTNFKVVGQLTEMFRDWGAENKAKIDHPKAAAELFFAIAMYDTPVKSMLGAVPEESNCGQIEWRIAPSLSFFIQMSRRLVLPLQ